MIPLDVSTCGANTTFGFWALISATTSAMGRGAYLRGWVTMGGEKRSM
jgi:hypothetical protein